VSGSYLNPSLLGMTFNKNVLKNIGGEITDGILLNGDAQKIKIITGDEITCPHKYEWSEEKISGKYCMKEILEYYTCLH
jgi:hypothetical protein